MPRVPVGLLCARSRGPLRPGHLGGVGDARARREWALMPYGITAGSWLRLGLRGRCSARYLDEGIFSVFR